MQVNQSPQIGAQLNENISWLNWKEREIQIIIIGVNDMTLSFLKNCTTKSGNCSDNRSSYDASCLGHVTYVGYLVQSSTDK